jgi:hypothetical protein
MRPRLALLFALLSPFGIAFAQNPADIAFLQDNVHEIAPGYNSGSLVVFGDQAFPVVTGRSPWGATEPVIAAARFGKGRLAVMGNSSALEQGVLKVAGTGRMLANILHWIAGEKSAPRIGIYRVPGLAARLKGLSLDARDIELADRNQVDAVVILARMVEAKDVAALQEYVRAGGGVLTAGVYYMIQARFAGMDLATEIPASCVTAPAGIVWAHEEAAPASSRGFRVEPPAALSHAGRALEAFEAG